MTDCILYGRVSTDKQDMQRQERMFSDYCHRNLLNPVVTLLDEDTSGSIPFQEREYGGRLFPEIRGRIPLGKIEVVTTEQDRIGRDTLDIIATIGDSDTRSDRRQGELVFDSPCRRSPAHANRRRDHALLDAK